MCQGASSACLAPDAVDGAAGDTCCRGCCYRARGRQACVCCCGLGWVVTFALFVFVAWQTSNQAPGKGLHNLKIKGLDGPVTIEYTPEGIPHISATTAHDAWAAQGAVTAQLRLWQMEFQRRVGQGRVAEVAGKAGLDFDKLMRTLGVYKSAQATYNDLNAHTQAALQAYADGVNAYLASNPRLPLEFTLLGYRPEPWVPADSLVWAKIMSFDLSGNMRRELQRYSWMAGAGVKYDRVMELLPTLPDWPTVLETSDLDGSQDPYPKARPWRGTVQAVRNATDTADMQAWLESIHAAKGAWPGDPKAKEAAKAPIPGDTPAPKEAAASSSPGGSLLGDVLRLGLGGALFNAGNRNGLGLGGHGYGGLFRGPKGNGASNNWVVGPDRTCAKCGAMLQNDPHLQLMAPSVWFLAALHADTVDKDVPGAPPLDVTGATFPGLPGIVIGRNKHVAWGVTNTGADIQDLYVIHELSEDEYMFDGKPTRFDVSEEIIAVKGGDDVVLKLRKTVQGVVITDNGIPAQDVMKTGTNWTQSSPPLALRWISTDDKHVADTTMDAFLKLNEATNWSTFREAARAFVAPPQNVVFMDTEGNFGYQMPGRYPRRDHTGMFPAPGDGSGGGKYEWQTMPASATNACAEDYAKVFDNKCLVLVDPDDLPRTLNPPKGFVVSANNRIFPRAFGKAGFTLTNDFDDTVSYRAERITDLITQMSTLTKKGGAKLDTAGMQKIQLDLMSYTFRDLKPLLEHMGTAGLSADAVAWRKKLLSWDGVMAVGAEEATVFNGWVAKLRTLAGPEIAAKDLEDAIFLVHAFVHAWDSDPACLKHGDCRKFAAQQFNAVAAHAVGDVAAWGKDNHKAVFASQTLGKTPLACLANREVGHGGDDDTVNVGHWGKAPDFPQGEGPSYRQIIDGNALDDPARSLFVNPMGQSGEEFSPLYDNMLLSWADGKYYGMSLTSYKTVDAWKVELKP